MGKEFFKDMIIITAIVPYIISCLSQHTIKI